jgi:hypothetical protein
LKERAEKQAQASVLKTLLAITQHFGPCLRSKAGDRGRCVESFNHLFAGVSDPHSPLPVRIHHGHPRVASLGGKKPASGSSGRPPVTR